MNADERIQELNQIPPMSKYQMKRARRTALVLATTTIISLLFLIYAFIQKQEADHQREYAIQMKMEAENQRAIAKKNEKMAMAARLEAERQRLAAEQALEACSKSKK